MAGQWTLSFRLPLTFEEGNTCNIITGWKLILTKSCSSRCSSNPLQSEGPAFRVFGMLRSLAKNGRVSDRQTWALAECIRWPWNEKPSFSFASLLMENCLKLEAFKKKTLNSTRVCGAVSFNPSIGERGWDRNGSAFAVACSGNSEIAWQMASSVDTLTLFLLLPLLASEWVSGQSYREKSAR